VSVSTLTKQTISYFQKKLILFLMLRLLIFSMIYYDIVIRVGIQMIQSVAYDNYDDFQHVNFIFSQKIVSIW